MNAIRFYGVPRIWRTGQCLMRLIAVMLLGACGSETDVPDDKATTTRRTQSETLSFAVARQAIELANARSGDALLRGDVNGILARYAADASGTTPNDDRWHGLSELTSITKSLLDSLAFTSVRKSTGDVLVLGDIAVETGSGSLSFHPRHGKGSTATLRYLAVWRRQRDGSLKVIRELTDFDSWPQR